MSKNENIRIKTPVPRIVSQRPSDHFVEEFFFKVRFTIAAGDIFEKFLTFELSPQKFRFRYKRRKISFGYDFALKKMKFLKIAFFT